MGSLTGKVAVVAGATRGAGRGIAVELGAAGATVYCTGRSVRGAPSSVGRPETIEETAAMVTATGGAGLWAQVDHTQPDQVRALIERVRAEQGRLDILVNDLTGDQYLTGDMLSGKGPVRFWDYPIENGLGVLRNGVQSHLITAHFAAPLLIASGGGLIVEVTDGNCLLYNNVGVYYSLEKTSLVLLAYFMAEELKARGVAVVSLTPGWLRSEAMLDGFGVTEANWRDAVASWPSFEDSETPFYVGRAVVALATDPDIMARTGRALSAGYLAREYGFTDVDGRQPPGYCREGAFADGYFALVDPAAPSDTSKPWGN
jgi:NAD(P)-dependent dehydrogenase (short-subunit alcohol dehydrogenase family)